MPASEETPRLIECRAKARQSNKILPNGAKICERFALQIFRDIECAEDFALQIFRCIEVYYDVLRNSLEESIACMQTVL